MPFSASASFNKPYHHRFPPAPSSPSNSQMEATLSPPITVSSLSSSSSSIFNRLTSDILQQTGAVATPLPPGFPPFNGGDISFFDKSLSVIADKTGTIPPSSFEKNDSDFFNYFFINGLSEESTSSSAPSPSLTSSSPVENDEWLIENSFFNVTFTSNMSSEAAQLLDESWWNVFDERYLRHSMAWTITLAVAYLLILIVGVIGNFMVILVVLLRRQMRSVTNMFIMNLAVADLFVIVFCVPATLMSNIFAPWILGSFMCKGVAYVQGVSVCASAYSLAAISLDRCKAIYRPMERPRGLSKSQALSTICLIWIVALLMTIPWAVIFDVLSSDKDGLPYCIETWANEFHGKIYFLVANLIMCYCLPLVLISISNVIIWCHVSNRKVPTEDLCSASAAPIKRMHKKARHGVRKMLGIVTLAFLVSWLPLYILVTRMKFAREPLSDEESNLLDILMPVAQWLGSWNSSVNPVLYAFLNSKFREMFKSLFPSWVPFIHRNSPLVRGVGGQGGTLTYHGGTFRGTTRTQSYSTMYTARGSSGRYGSSINSRRFGGGGSGHHAHHHQQSHNRNSFMQHYNNNGHSHNNQQRTLLVSNFRDGGSGAPAVVTTTAAAAATAATMAIVTPVESVMSVVEMPKPADLVISTTGTVVVGCGGGGNSASTSSTTTTVTKAGRLVRKETITDL